MANWSEENTLILIETYRNHPVLWNPNDLNYYKKHLKEDAWKEIAELTEQTIEVCKNKITSVLASWRREKKKERDSKTTGKGASEVYTSRWFGYEACKFLEDRDKPRTGTNTESMAISIDDTEDNVENEQATMTAGESSESTEPFRTPKPSKRARKPFEENRTTAIMSDALSLLKTATTKLSTPTSEPPEHREVRTFLDFVMTKMISYSQETRNNVQHSMFQILMNADRGFYESRIQNAYGQHPQSQIPTPLYLERITQIPVNTTMHQYMSPSTPLHSFPTIHQNSQRSSDNQQQLSTTLSPTQCLHYHPQQSGSELLRTAFHHLSSSDHSTPVQTPLTSPCTPSSQPSSEYSDDFNDFI